MKLYTEEQVKLAMHLSVLTDSSFTFKEIFKQLTPIELPSDEDIEDKGKWVFNNAGHTIFTNYNTVPSWVEGAKWMKEQILGKEDKTFKQKSKWTEVDNMTRRLK